MINKKQLNISGKFALFFVAIKIFSKLLHFSSLLGPTSLLFAVFHGWLFPLCLAGLLLYYTLVTSICYLVCRVLNYLFNLVWR